MEAQFKEIINKIFNNKLPKKIAIAVSGGLDSMALLLLLKNVFGEKIKIFCLTVDHNIRQNSYLDAQLVASFCAANSIHCSVLKSYLQHQPESDIEGSLRVVRYNLLTDFCSKNKIKYLFLGHHRQDLAENFLIRLFRGSGIDGLAAMHSKTAFQDEKIKLIRPLLEFSKADLKQYLQNKKVSWAEDETNEDEKFLRNKIRNFLKSLPDFEFINNRIALASEAILEAKKIIEKETRKNFPKIFKISEVGLVMNLRKFQKLEKTVATRYLALALMQISMKIYKPRLQKLMRIYQLIIENKLNKKEEFYGCKLSKINDYEILIERLITKEI